jgi:hypothetical protein
MQKFRLETIEAMGIALRMMCQREALLMAVLGAARPTLISCRAQCAL